MRGYDGRPRFDEAVNSHAVFEPAHAEHRAPPGGCLQRWQHSESVEVDPGWNDFDAILRYPIVLDQNVTESIRQDDHPLGAGVPEALDDVLGAGTEGSGSCEPAFCRPGSVEVHN
ncbi:Uncharacterised protein [Mycobacteroides abscessus subsp. massiliense]|nr:Uncharacterised protein [Mycobacteroides abscessus subsp. massiliense]